jgi:hypothetical protein
MERVVVVVGCLVSYGFSALAAAFLTILAVSGEGRNWFMYALALMFGALTIACFMFSVRLADRGRHVLAILLGFVPVPLGLAVVYLGLGIHDLFTGKST